jgi:Mrp family chromosome partitioning ATPase
MLNQERSALPPYAPYPSSAATTAPAAGNEVVKAFDAIQFRMLAEGLLSRPSPDCAAVIGLTAMQSGSGVSSLAARLAAALTKEVTQRILLIDAHPSPRRLPQLLGLSGPQPLSIDQIAPHAASENAPLAGIHALSGYDMAVLDGAPGLERQQGFMAWWQAALRHYSIILVDLGPLNSGLPHRWNGIINQFVLVLDAGSATREMAENLRDDDAFTKLPFKGFILNKRRFYVPEFVYRWFA